MKHVHFSYFHVSVSDTCGTLTLLVHVSWFFIFIFETSDMTNTCKRHNTDMFNMSASLNVTCSNHKSKAYESITRSRDLSGWRETLAWSPELCSLYQYQWNQRLGMVDSPPFDGRWQVASVSRGCKVIEISNNQSKFY